MAQILDGKSSALVLKNELKAAIAKRVQDGHRRPGLALIVSVTDDASQSYLQARRQWATFLGIDLTVWNVTEQTRNDDVIQYIQSLNANPLIDGIMLDHPLPSFLDEGKLIRYIDPAKDIDGMHPLNSGDLFQTGGGFIPNTARGVMELLKYYQINLVGQHVVVVGRSNTVGKPLAQLLLHAHATVTICHSKTPHLETFTKQADILVVAIGKRGFITNDYINDHCVVVDVGTHYGPDGKMSGDVDPNVANKALWMSPVPGGVGPMTTLALMMNVYDAYLKQEDGKHV